MKPRATTRDEPFTLARQPARLKQRTIFDNNPAKAAKALFSGSDCLPGQLGLLPPDGPRERLTPTPVSLIDFWGIDAACDHCCQPLDSDDEALVTEAGRVYCCCRCAGEARKAGAR